MQLILRDGSAIDLVEATTLKHFVVICEDVTEFVAIWDKMTLENLSEVALKEGDTAIQTISNLILVGTQTTRNSDGSITGHFYTDGGEFRRDEYAEAGRILLGEGV